MEKVVGEREPAFKSGSTCSTEYWSLFLRLRRGFGRYLIFHKQADNLRTRICTCSTTWMPRTRPSGRSSKPKGLPQESGTDTWWVISNPTSSSTAETQAQRLLETFGELTSSGPPRGRRSTSLHSNLPCPGCTTARAFAALGRLQAWWSFLEEEGQTRFPLTTLGGWGSTGMAVWTGWKHLRGTANSQQRGTSTGLFLLVLCSSSLEAVTTLSGSHSRSTYTTRTTQTGTVSVISTGSGTPASCSTTTSTFTVALIRKCRTYPQIRSCVWTWTRSSVQCLPYTKDLRSNLARI